MNRGGAPPGSNPTKRSSGNGPLNATSPTRPAPVARTPSEKKLADIRNAFEAAGLAATVPAPAPQAAAGSNVATSAHKDKSAHAPDASPISAGGKVRRARANGVGDVLAGPPGAADRYMICDMICVRADACEVWMRLACL